MNDEYQQNQPVEAKSSIKIKTTAKGEALTEASVYEGTSEEEMSRIAALAAKAYLETRDALVGKVVLA